MPQTALWVHFLKKVLQKAGSKPGASNPAPHFLSQKCLKSDLHCKFYKFAKIAKFAIFAKMLQIYLQHFGRCIATLQQSCKKFTKNLVNLLKISFAADFLKFIKFLINFLIFRAREKSPKIETKALKMRA